MNKYESVIIINPNVDDEKLKGKDVDDPWYTRDFDLCFNEIEKGCEGLLLHLKEEV